MGSNVCLVCLTLFESIRKDAEFCGPACRQKASRDRKKGAFIPAWTDYYVTHAQDTYTLTVHKNKYKSWASITSTEDDEPLPNFNWRELVKYHMKNYHTVLFICLHREDILKVVDEINKNRVLLGMICTGPLL